MTTPPLPSPENPPDYRDDDLVYVDPESRTVIGRVEWGKNDKPKSLPYRPVERPVKDGTPSSKTKTGTKEKSDRGQFWRKNFPWGTFRSMRRIYKLRGKVKDPEPNRSLDEVLPRALQEAYWTWEQHPNNQKNAESPQSDVPPPALQ